MKLDNPSNPSKPSESNESPVGLPPVDFGGDGPLLHLAHANAYPPGTYRPLAMILAKRYHVLALPARPLWPGSRPQEIASWHPLADDLIAGLDRLGAGPIVGIGHSMGGVCTLWAAVARPDLFRAVVLIDPVILPPLYLAFIRLLSPLGVMVRPAMIRRTLRRRRIWPSREACFVHYRAKPVFAAWSDDSLWAYVEAGTRMRPDDGTVELVYPPEWEAHIYATVPTDVWQAIPRLRLPVLIIRGARSETFLPASLQRITRLLPHTRTLVVPDAGHLVPMERPEVVGEAVLSFLSEGVDVVGADSQARMVASMGS